MRNYLTPEKKCIDCEEVFKVRSPSHKRCDKCADKERIENAKRYNKKHALKIKEQYRKWYEANKEYKKKYVAERYKLKNEHNSTNKN